MKCKIGDTVRYSKFAGSGAGVIESEFSEDIWIINGRQCYKDDVIEVILSSKYESVVEELFEEFMNGYTGALPVSAKAFCYFLKQKEYSSLQNEKEIENFVEWKDNNSSHMLGAYYKSQNPTSPLMVNKEYTIKELYQAWKKIKEQKV